MLKISNQVHYHKLPARQLIESLVQWRPEYDFLLTIDDQQISIGTQIQQQRTCFHHSFTSPQLLQRARQKKQALLKACNSKKGDIHRLVDLTAGWGKDSFILASHGQSVSMIEQHPLVFGAVEFLLRIGAHDTTQGVFSRLSIHHSNSLDYLNSIDNDKPDCLYLDPMFPAHKSSARPGKDLQILQLLTDNVDMLAVFKLSLDKAGKRVVVKRPLHAPTMDSLKPNIVYREKTIRFDVYLT